MICSLVKWLVSQSLDSGNPLPPFAERHLASCRSCAGFRSLSMSVGKRLERDAAGAEKRLTSSPVEAFRPGPVQVLVAVAAVVCVVLIAGQLVVDAVRSGAAPVGPGPNRELTAAVSLPTPASIEELSREVWLAMPEIRIDREMARLEMDTQAAARFLVASITLPD